METYGGAERVTQELAKAFPEAPVVALMARRSVARRMGVEDRTRSLLAPRERVFGHYRLLAPAFPALARAARLPFADVVLSSSYGFAHHMSAPGAVHVSYCHSPLRFAWTMTQQYQATLASGHARGAAFRVLAAGMRQEDRRASARVDRFLTQSPYVADQIQRFYGRTADVVGAPVNAELFRPGSGYRRSGHFLFCGRLIEPYKRVGLVIEAFRELPYLLTIAGDGPARAELEAAAPRNVKFVGALDDSDLVAAMQSCTALIFPSRDDFGLLPVEVMACGRPVLAYAAGGALHTVVPGVTGELFAEQTREALVEAIEQFDPAAFDPAAIRAHALQWDAVAFRHRIRAAVEQALEDPRGARGSTAGVAAQAVAG